MIGQRGYRPGTVPEAAALADAADLVLTKADGLQLQILCIVDREQDPARTFLLDLATIISTAKQCIHYTGTFNGTKLPVGVQIWEVGPNAGAAPEVARLRPLARTWPGRDKVLVSAWTLDTTSHTVTSNARWGGRLAGRGALEKLREPRRPDHELTPPPPAPNPWFLTSNTFFYIELLYKGTLKLLTELVQLSETAMYPVFNEQE